MQLSQVHKYLLKSKMEVYILYKRVWSDQRTGSRNRRGGATSSEVAPEYFGAKWQLSRKISGSLKYHVWYLQSLNSIVDIMDVSCIQIHGLFECSDNKMWLASYKMLFTKNESKSTTTGWSFINIFVLTSNFLTNSNIILDASKAETQL